MKIIFTGGGSAGHVTPNLALIKRLQQYGWDINYIGSKTGIEREIISKQNIPYYSIATGKLRRYFSWQNFIDPLKIIFGILQAIILVIRLRPDVIFSKGGFVAFPVVISGWLRQVPVIIHESDLTMGLANRLCAPFAKKICVTFPQTIDYIKNQTIKNKAVVTGTPVREDFFYGDAVVGRKVCDFSPDKKIILVFGGSLGADAINIAVRKLLPNILTEFQVVHVCGEGKVDSNYNYVGYKQFTYLHENFAHVLAAADLVISRSGANSLYELLLLRKPSILIPLSNGSRGDQVLNARYFFERGYSEMILQKNLTLELLLEKIKFVEKNSIMMIAKMSSFEVLNSCELICNIILCKS